MRHPSRHPRLLLRIKTLDQRDLVRPLRILEVPPVIRVGSHGVRLAFARGVDESHADEVRVGDGVGVCDGEGVFEDCFYGAPDLGLLLGLGIWERGGGRGEQNGGWEKGGTNVDDLEAVLEELFGFVGEVVRHAGKRSSVGLVDVHTADRATQRGGGVGGAFADVLGLPTDGVVEDEDAGGAGAKWG